MATRYDTRRYVYLGTATAAALTIWAPHLMGLGKF